MEVSAVPQLRPQTPERVLRTTVHRLQRTVALMRTKVNRVGRVRGQAQAA